MEIAEIEVSYKTNSSTKVKINRSLDAYNVLIDTWDFNKIELQEEFKIIILNRASQVLGIHSLSKGGTSATIVDNTGGPGGTSTNFTFALYLAAIF